MIITKFPSVCYQNVVFSLYIYIYSLCFTNVLSITMPYVFQNSNHVKTSHIRANMNTLSINRRGYMQHYWTYMVKRNISIKQACFCFFVFKISSIVLRYSERGLYKRFDSLNTIWLLSKFVKQIKFSRSPHHVLDHTSC